MLPALFSDRHLSPPTLCIIYPALATRHEVCNRREPAACKIGGKANLPRELKWTNWNSPCLKITNMDARSRVAPSGDYVLLAPSGDYNQTIPPKSTNRIRCFTSLTVLLPTSGKLARGIWEINREKIVVLIVTSLFKNIQEHSVKFKNIRGYSNGKIKFKNIQDFRRPVRTLVSGIANSVFTVSDFDKFRLLPFQIFKILFHFFQAIFFVSTTLCCCQCFEKLIK